MEQFRKMADLVYDKGIIATGEHEATCEWLLLTISYVGQWPRPVMLHLRSHDARCESVTLRIRNGCIQAIERGSEEKSTTNRLAALDHCAELIIPIYRSAAVSRFRFAVASDPKSMMLTTGLNWQIDRFCMSLAGFLDLLADEVSQLEATGITQRRYKLGGASGCAAESGEETSFLALLEARLRVDGRGVDALAAAQNTGLSVRSSAALLTRLWRRGVLTDRA